jgi:hypothetical protein
VTEEAIERIGLQRHIKKSSWCMLLKKYIYILYSLTTRLYFKAACYHQYIDVTFGVQVRYHLKNGETEATGKRLRTFNGDRNL